MLVKKSDVIIRRPVGESTHPSPLTLAMLARITCDRVVHLLRLDGRPGLPVPDPLKVRLKVRPAEAAEEMVGMGFGGRKDGFKVLMPKERRLAKRIGYTVTTTVNYGLGQTGQERNIRYWTYHEDDEHYAIVLVSASALEGLGLT